MRPIVATLLLNFGSHLSDHHIFAVINVPTQQVNNPSPLIPLVPQLDGNFVMIPAWNSQLLNVLIIQGVLEIVNKSIPHPRNTGSHNSKAVACPPEQHD